MSVGLSGAITRAFITSPLTPLLLLAALAVGFLALGGLPREEEPQISVPMVDILIEANGLRAIDAVELVTKPLEDVVKGIDAVEHVYSQTLDDRVLVTARFQVGTDEDVAMLRVHETIRANYDRIPLGIPEPLIVGRGINDVPILVITLSGQGVGAERWTRNALTGVARDLLPELMKDPDIGLTFLVGTAEDRIRVEPDPERLAAQGVTLNQLVEKVENANRSFLIGPLRAGNQSLSAVAGQTLQGLPDIGQLLITTREGRPVYVADVARVVVGAAPEEHRLWQGHPVAEKDGVTGLDWRPAVSLALAKRKGANAVVVAEALRQRLDTLQGRLIPPGVAVEISRDYGQTAQEKADELLFHLGLATASIVLLITLAVGWREGLVVAVVIPTTILLTLFASWLMGYTLNRVSLFALIFSIGILVDDAIVVVENIARHWARPDGRAPDFKTLVDKAIEGVAEVGNPTIVATLTIVAALLPMMAVSGLMGPYMSPIPANASAAMVFSFFVAVVITPWLLLQVAGRRVLRRQADAFAALAAAEGALSPAAAGGMSPAAAGGMSPAAAGGMSHDAEGALGRFYRRVAGPLLVSRRRAWSFLLVTGVATILVCTLFYTRHVTVKLLPFDNKSEFQVVVDLPEGSSLEETERVLRAAARRLADLPELSSLQLHVGTAAPFNFNGLVRHAYRRDQPNQGDLQINLVARTARERASHAIALEARQRLADLPVPPGTSLKVVEVPPGPPVLATLLAEIYGPSEEARLAALARVKAAFQAVPFIVDIDDMAGQPAPRVRFSLDSEALALHGVEEAAVYDTLQALIGGVSVGYSHRGQGARPVEIVVGLPPGDLTPGERLLATPVPAAVGTVELGDVVRMQAEEGSRLIYRRDGHFVEMVLADLAGTFEAPLYGMLAVNARLAADPDPLPTTLHGQPRDESSVTLLWDGEWEITYVTFRDMGAAFGVALLGIYLLVVAQFRSFKIPLLILVPVPLTFIGIVLGHWLFGAPFSAPSMIGFIALAGIIVRNSILLVDFIRHRRPEAPCLRAALLEAGAIRVKPILLTALAAMIGGAFILGDPIFQGLALSLVFGLASSTLLTVLVIPALYVVLRDDGVPFPVPAGSARPTAL